MICTTARETRFVSATSEEFSWRSVSGVCEEAAAGSRSAAVLSGVFASWPQLTEEAHRHATETMAVMTDHPLAEVLTRCIPIGARMRRDWLIVTRAGNLASVEPTAPLMGSAGLYHAERLPLTEKLRDRGWAFRL